MNEPQIREAHAKLKRQNALMVQLPVQLRSLIDAPLEQAGRQLTEELCRLYDGDLNFPQHYSAGPYVIANFVTTLDGVVSYKIPGHAGGSAISGADHGDRFLMGLLRASADAVLVGAGTVRDVEPETLWTPEYAYPPAAVLYAHYRRHRALGSAAPYAVIVSGSGRLALNTAAFHSPNAPAVVLTTPTGRARLLNAGIGELAAVQMHAIDAPGTQIGSQAILAFLRDLGVHTLLHEGGPRLFGHFVEDKAVQELFLTLSPQIAGRGADGMRPALVQGVQFSPRAAPWLQLLSAKCAADHLYLRYRYRRDNARTQA